MAGYKCEKCTEAFKQKRQYNSHINQCIGLNASDRRFTPPKPFLKWVGGKTQIIDTVLAHFPREMNNYHEPFLGGGSVLLALLAKKAAGLIRITGNIWASDINPTLIGLYQNIQRHPDALIAEMKRLTDVFVNCKGTVINRKATTLDEATTSPESYYYWIRSKFNALPVEDRATVPASAMMLFMNKTCFRGVYREGPNGFNVPYGNYKNPGILDEAHIQTISTLIRDVIFTAIPFSESLSKVESGDFVYMDPPYAPRDANSFVSYTSDGFDRESHSALFALCHTMTLRNTHLLLSNADVKMVRDAFPEPEYITTTVSCRRAIHSKNPESRTNEVLISNRL
jgi:DNA adenine methylase